MEINPGASISRTFNVVTQFIAAAFSKRPMPVVSLLIVKLLALLSLLLWPYSISAHPMGNFSISHYASITVKKTMVEVRYIINMAEIPTFQEIQNAGLVPEAGHPGLPGYLAQKAEQLKKGLLLELNGRRLTLQAEPQDIIFPSGAGGLPTTKFMIIYRAALNNLARSNGNYLHYQDRNFPDRAGWKEIIVEEGPGMTLLNSSVPEQDKSAQLTNYPTDLLNSPPQTLEATLLFSIAGLPQKRPSAPPTIALPLTEKKPAVSESHPQQSAARTFPLTRSSPGAPVALPNAMGHEEGTENSTIPPQDPQTTRLQPNQQATPRNVFTELITTKQLGFWVIIMSVGITIVLGAFHALEPGHGKTVVAAYLVGARGTTKHAMLLGLIVTLSHTTGVYLIGAITLYASRYIVPEQLYPWLGVASGLVIAGLGFFLFLQRYHTHTHHSHSHGQVPSHKDMMHAHKETHDHRDGRHHYHIPKDPVSLRELFVLGVSGGIIPCPAALVVLLSAFSLNRMGFGLLLITAFSIGLAAMLIGIGLLVVHAKEFMARFHIDGPLFSQWLPLTSSALITVFGVTIAANALITAGILKIQL